jgi:hypothetical protein
VASLGVGVRVPEVASLGVGVRVPEVTRIFFSVSFRPTLG